MFQVFPVVENMFAKVTPFLKTLGVEDVIGKVLGDDEWQDIVTGICLLGASQAGTRALKDGETRAKVIDSHRTFWKTHNCNIPAAIDEYLKKATA